MVKKQTCACAGQHSTSCVNWYVALLQTGEVCNRFAAYMASLNVTFSLNGVLGKICSR